MLATSPKLMCFMTCVQWKWNIYNQQEKSQIHDCCPRGESWGDQGKLWSTGGTRPRPGNRPIHECLRGDIPKKDHHKQRHGGRTVCGLTECVTLTDGPRSPNHRGKLGGGQVNLCVSYGQFWLLQVNDFTEHPGQSMGVLPFPQNAAKSIRIPRTLRRTYIISLYGHRCLNHSPPLWNLSSTAGDKLMEPTP